MGMGRGRGYLCLKAWTRMGGSGPPIYPEVSRLG